MGTCPGRPGGLSFPRDASGVAELSGVKLEERGCPFGCPRDDLFLCSGRDRFHGIAGEFSVLRCRSCGLIRTDPRPTPDSMGLFYPEEYAPYRLSEGTPANAPPSVLRRLAARVVPFNTRALPKLPPGRMLEIGCASGDFLRKMAGQGWEVEGVEFSPKAAGAAASLGYRVYAGSLESAPDPPAPYDLVVGWMVVEHLHEPVQALHRLRNWVRPGGWLAFSVPDVSSWEFLLCKEAYYGLHLPNHLYHFDPVTVRRLLEESGWKFRKLMHQRVIASSFSTLGFWLRDRGGSGRVVEWLVGLPTAGVWVNLALYPLASLLAAIGQSGRMTVWAQRDD